MHLFGIPSLSDDEIDDAVKELEDESLFDLQHELQAAVTYHNHAQTYGDDAFTHQTYFGNGASDEASSEKVGNASQFRDIINSELYRTAVEELAERNGLDVSEDYIGWIGMTQDEIESTNDALDTVARRDAAQRLGPIQAPDEQDLNKSTAVLDQQDIDGYFVRAEDLNREFTEHYTLGPSTGGEWS